MQATSERHRWAIVLAGGEGQRMAAWIEGRFGRRIPKQYCDLAGERSMLEHAWSRALRAVPPRRLLTVIGPGHDAHLRALRCPDIPGGVLEQPVNRDTAPGVYLPLSRIMAEDPDATVALLPSDHYIRPVDAFQRSLDAAFRLAERQPTRPVLLGAVPDEAVPEYGWIEPAERLGRQGGPFAPRRVRSFREKPTQEEASAFLRRGFLWNTLVLVARARTLWELGLRHLPRMMPKFELLRVAFSGSGLGAGAALRWVYEHLEAANFSRDLLEPAGSRTAVLVLEGVEWSDWGRPERVERTLSALLLRRPN